MDATQSNRLKDPRSSDMSLDDSDPFEILLFDDIPPNGKPIFQTLTTQPESSRTSKRSSAAFRNVETPASPNSEFGSFVSVSATDDPLHQQASEEPRPSGSSTGPDQNDLDSSSAAFFDKFAEEAKQRTVLNERRVLTDLRGNDADPLGWLRSSTSTPPEVTRDGERSQSPDYFSIQPSGSPLIDLSTPSVITPTALPRKSQEALQSPTPRSSSSPPAFPRSNSETSLRHAKSHNRSPPPHSQSFASSLSRSWMSSLLSTTRVSPARTSSPLPTPAAISRSSSVDSNSDENAAQTVSMSPTESRLQELFLKSQHHGRTVPPPASAPTYRRHPRQATDPFAPHASTIGPSPFAAQVYIPPSGAPGFTGDRNWNTAGFEYDSAHPMKAVRLAGRKEMTTPILAVDVANSLRPHLPALARLSDTWTLLYSLDQHGISLNTLYSRCQVPPGGKAPGSAGSLLVATDADGSVFGVWISEGLRLSHGSYYGGGDSFMWSKLPEDSKPHIFKWTGRNDYVALCDTDYLSFGGGDGHYGLYIDSSLIEGTTHRCPTFNNDCLARGEQKGRMISFDCTGLEVWGVGP